MAFFTLHPDQTAEASGLFSFGRSLGTSIGISLISTLLTVQTQVNWQRLGGHIQPYSHNLDQWLIQRGLSIDNPLALQQLASDLHRQAQMIAFLDSYWIVGIALMVLLPLVLLLRFDAKAVTNASVAMH